MADTGERRRFFVPNKSWEFVDDNEKNKSVDKGFKFFNWTLSFTKTVVQIAFIIFILANLFIMGMIIWHNIRTGELYSMDTYIDRVYEMFIAVIGGYIIKSAVENSIRISFSVINDYLEKKLQIQIDKDNTETLDVETPVSDTSSDNMPGYDPNEDYM